MHESDQTSTPAKDTAVGGADQSTPPHSIDQQQRGAHLLPWILLGVWLAIDLGVVLYWSSQDWGFLGDLPLIIGCAGSYVGGIL